MLYQTFRNLAFRMDPEFVHDLTLGTFHHFPKSFAMLMPGVKWKRGKDTSCYQTLSTHLDWSFPVGIAAGLDKQGEAISYFSQLGFGSVEVGTVTRYPQMGNPKPRLFRYPQWESFRNYMGFPNQGVEAVLTNINAYQRSASKRASVGINLGINKDKVNDLNFDDYRFLYQQLHNVSDYLVLNVSSPNTVDLRKWQSQDRLRSLLASLADLRAHSPTPLFIKVAPELSVKELQEVAEVAKEFQLAGVVATNTVVKLGLGKGGVSGRLLYQKASKTRQVLLEALRECPEMDVIGVGGFFDFEQILQFWKMGGRFVQIYTSFIYKGPNLLREIQQGIDELLQREKCRSLQTYFDSLKK